jgi:hypothetical protein
MKKILTSILGILLVTGLVVAEQPEGKGKEKTPGPVQVLANGTSIGAFLQSNGNLFVGGEFWALSDTGYLFNVTPFSITTRVAGDLKGERIGFTGPNCTGRSFAITSGLERQAQFFSGYVFVSEDPSDPNPAYYSPANSRTVIDVLQESVSRPIGCQPTVGVITFGVEVFQNVQLITGVANQRNLGGPITLGR